VVRQRMLTLLVASGVIATALVAQAAGADSGPVPICPPSPIPALTGVTALAGQFTHAWPTTGRTFGSWIRNFYSARGFRRWSAGENLLWASPGFTSANAVQQWLASPIHRRVMLTPSWRELGVGVVTASAAPGAYGGRDVQIAAAEFGKRS
jgi:hypothetical protein